MYIRVRTIIYSLGFLFISSSHAPIPTRFQKVEADISHILRIQPQHVRKSWNVEQIRKTAQELVRAELILGIPVYKFYALIHLEDSWRYDRCSGNFETGRKKRRRISQDCGLTQQNTSGTHRGYARGLVQPRCWRIFKRSCRRWELFIPNISVRLMVERFKECAEFSGDTQFLCYDSVTLDDRERYLRVWRTYERRYRSYQ